MAVVGINEEQAERTAWPAFALASRRTPSQLSPSAFLSAPFVCVTFLAVIEPVDS